MRKKRKYGYILLTALVISGLAGSPTDNSPTKKERKFATDHMKSSKTELANAIKGLSAAQLNFREAADKWTIQECVYHIAISEKNLWGMLEATLKAPANPEKRSQIKMSDEQVVKTLEDRSFKVKTNEQFEPKNTPYKSLEEAMTDFKATRTEHIKYVKTTTEDLRNHVAETPLGWVDAYQICLFLSAHNNRHTQQIREVKAAAAFPKG
jgi:hypothetical protein